MKFTVFPLVALALMAVVTFTAPAAKAADLEGSKKFIDSMAQRGINFLADPNLSVDGRKAEFDKLLQTSFDTATIGKFALGTYWKTATPAQQTEYQKLFKSMIIEVYSKRFNEYKGQKIQVTGARADGDRDVLVSSTIIPPDGGDSVPVDWRVRNNKVIDVIVAGVSMAVNQRSDFASVIQRGGGNVDVLLQHLRTNAGK